jgi:PAS domain-containing protein
LDVNPSACSILGFSRDELLNTPTSAIHPYDLPELEAFAVTVFQQGKGWTNELSCVTKAESAGADVAVLKGFRAAELSETVSKMLA